MTTDDAAARVILAVAAEADDSFIWEQLHTIQTAMFAAGSISLKFAFFGAEGPLATRRPCMTSRWVTDADDMDNLLDKARARCVCGCYVDIKDILTAAVQENKKAPVEAVVIVGDTFHSSLKEARALAKELQAAGTRLVLIQQNTGGRRSDRTEAAYRALAEQTGGAYIAINPAVERIAQRLPSLLQAVSHLAIGGTEALKALDDSSAALLLEQMK
jgi:hypothetical protein